ncbi:12362_t:CDS:2 [Funneliformis geosporum]|uniref:12251_t:CDS:1 n=1 Tax=Funneliformis geosporum TaxID=1117311 RepID=A0A9W4STG5_9GLOM|nr:12251_t:CDS:2 [Funneliformis geosporum]CAI2193822.1 12362_t:CDS:2 [Funneliformis geosporum]
MPKNTYFIKENYKKVEEVREIENEVPNYEEFLKNYNSDEKVSDSYENELNSYSDIGVNFHSSYWHHTPGCGSRLQVSNKARIRCSGCSFNCDLKDYYFACSSHRGDYRTMDRNSFNKALGIALQNEDCSQVMVDLSMFLVNHR